MKQIGKMVILVCFFLNLHYAAAQWVSKNVPYGGAIYSLAVKGANLFAGTDTGSILVSTDDGDSWTPASGDLGNNMVYALVVSDTDLFAAIGGQGVFRSSDDGSTWAPVNTGLTTGWIFSLGVSGTNILAGGEGGRICLSTNNGDSWVGVSTGWTTADVKGFVQSGNNLLAGSYGEGIILSIDSGVSWIQADTGLTKPCVNCLAVSGSGLFAGTDTGVFLSTNNGSSWRAVNVGLSCPIISLAVDGTNLFAGVLGNGAFQSTDCGSTWYDFGDGLPVSSWVDALTIKHGYIFSGTRAGGVFRRPLSEALPVELDGFCGSCTGSTIELRWKTATEINNYGFEVQKRTSDQWRAIGFVRGAGTSNSPRQYVFVDGCPSGGISSYRLKQMDRDGKSCYSQSISVRLSGVLKEVSLGQNYPNPFNSTTFVSFDLPEASLVSLKIYDCIGREVTTLLKGDLPAGQYQQRFDADRLASGLYFYRLTVGARSLIRTMLLVK